jgi:hypothetical protein
MSNKENPEKPKVHYSPDDEQIFIEQTRSDGFVSYISIKPTDVNSVIERLQDCLHESGFEARNNLLPADSPDEECVETPVKSIDEAEARAQSEAELDAIQQDSQKNDKWDTQVIKFQTGGE